MKDINFPCLNDIYKNYFKVSGYIYIYRTEISDI